MRIIFHQTPIFQHITQPFQINQLSIKWVWKITSLSWDSHVWSLHLLTSPITTQSTYIHTYVLCMCNQKSPNFVFRMRRQLDYLPLRFTFDNTDRNSDKDQASSCAFISYAFCCCYLMLAKQVLQLSVNRRKIHIWYICV